ncbi:hypothetical protein Pen02_52460 [Plantactinospora endophytica]|uniref:Uncharacterized protein n=1 Tax=Plantactinospora endophytica TaxID=673535 RepID=A0ABQ4E6I6_9ACTN|nr:hypothetical protein Pen02_52460 [Plantactinospora endophytica]
MILRFSAVGLADVGAGLATAGTSGAGEPGDGDRDGDGNGEGDGDGDGAAGAGASVAEEVRLDPASGSTLFPIAASPPQQSRSERTGPPTKSAAFCPGPSRPSRPARDWGTPAPYAVPAGDWNIGCCGPAEYAEG